MKWGTHYSPIGLDIGSNQVKMAQLKGRGTHWEVHGIAVAPLAELGDATAAESAERVVCCLRAMLASGSFVGKKTVSVLPSSEVDIRTVLVPLPLEPEEIQKTLRREAAAYLPYSCDEAILDSIIAGEDSGGGVTKQRRILVATRRQRVENHLALLQEVGLRCLALDALPFALSRLILRHQPASTATPLLVVDVGCRYSTAFILWQGILLYNRTFSWGGALLTQAMMQELKLSDEKAERLKQQLGIDPQATTLPTLTGASQRINMQAMPGLIYEIVRSQLEHLAQELERILSYWGTQSRGAVINRMFLSGGSAALKNFAGYLQRRIGIDVTIAEPLRHFYGHGDNEQEPTPQALCTPAMATAVGLALRGMPQYE